MILVKVLSDSIVITGHANYEDYGKDIVCSAVSSITTTTVNGLIALDDKCIEYEVFDGSMIITIKKRDIVTMKLIDNMLDLLKDLSKKYPNNVKIEEGV